MSRRHLGDNPSLARCWPHELIKLLRDLFVALLVCNLPDVLLCVLGFPDKPIVPLFLLDDVVSVVLVRLVGLRAVRENLDRVSQPPGVVPPWLQEAARQRALLQQFGLVAHGRVDAHVFQVPRRILVLDRMHEGFVEHSRRLNAKHSSQLQGILCDRHRSLLTPPLAPLRGIVMKNSISPSKSPLLLVFFLEMTFEGGAFSIFFLNRL